MLKKLVGFYIIFAVLQNVRGAEETIETSCNINGKKAIQCVSEKFLSISIDPAVLLAGVNLSEKSLRLAQHLSPAYIRIAGPSTSFVEYVDKDDRFANYLSEDGNNVIVTPSMWFGINEWFKLANLMPVFGINDADTDSGNWNPKETLPLLEISDKLNVSCYWQLGFDSTNKTEMRYEQDLNILHDILAAFPERNETWNIVGSDISQLPADGTDSTMEALKDIVTAVMWEPSHITKDSFPEKDMAYKILQKNSKPNVKIWTTVPKSSDTAVFSSVLLWAKQIGNAAKTGYDVVFRQPRMHELFTDTPVYWFSLLHKKLMGSNVLDAKTTANRAGTSIFAHCTRKQNSFVRRGALTVMIINENTETCSIKVKLGPITPEKSMEVQSYILTSPELNSTQVLLNGKLLTPDMLQEKHFFEPKLRRAKTPSHLLLSLPAMSVGFFVLPGARVPVCIEQEIETKLLLEEMEENRNFPLSEEVALKFGSRDAFVKNHFLDDITRKMKQEMMSDEKYYSHSFLKSRLEDSDDKKSTKEAKIDERGRKFFIDRVKLAEKHKKHNDFEKRREELKKFLLERSRLSKAEPKMESKVRELDLSSSEVERILKDRARARAARRNIVFTDQELRALVHKASKKFYKTKIKRSIPSPNRAKRDINVRLLERTIQMHPSCEKLHEDQDQEHEHLDLPNEQISKNIFIRKPRDINVKLVDLKSKLAETKSKWEDRKDEILGNTQMARENIKDRIRKLKNRNRFRRDINMELLEVKSKPGKKVVPDKKKPKKKKEMEATMRQPGQTSAELLEELEIEEGRQRNDHKAMPKTADVYAELADSEDLDEEDFFKPTPKSKKFNIFDKKSKLDPFAITNPSIEIVEPPFRKSKKNKKKSKSRSDNLQFLTSSEEFTDVEDDLPCIHEYFGPDSKSERKKEKNVITELGEPTSEEKSKRKKNKKMKNFSEETSSEEDLRRRKRDAYLEPYNPNEYTKPMGRLEYLESIVDDSKASNQESPEEEDINKGRHKRGIYLRKGPQEPTDFHNRINVLETLLDELESKYKACVSKKTEQTDGAPIHSTENSQNENRSEDTSSEKDQRRRRRDAYLEPYNPNEHTKPMGRLEYLESIVDDSKASDQESAEEEERNKGRHKRGLYLRKGPQEPTDFHNRINVLETLLDELESKYKACVSKKTEQTDGAPIHSTENSQNNNHFEDTSPERDLSRPKRDAYLQPYNPNEYTEPMGRLEYLESIMDEIDSKCKACNLQGKKATAQEEDRNMGRHKRGLYLTKGPQEPADFHSRIKVLETLLDELESKYKGERELPKITPENLDSITRQKRGNASPLGPDITSVENDFKDYKKDMKKHLKDLKQLLENDKVKFEEKKRKNKLRLLQLKKKQELELAKEALEVVSKVQKNETETGTDLLEHLRKIKEDLQHKKDKLDKLLMKDLKKQKEEIGDQSKLESVMSPGKQDVLTEESEDREIYGKDLKTIKSTPNELPKPSENFRNSYDKIPVEVKMIKRSIFDGKNVFGNYLPVTPELRMWKPADILSLKKDFNPFSTNKLIPPNDLHIFKNLFDQNSLLNLRKRRSIDSNMDNLENEIDTDINEIKKESQHFWPHKKSESGDLKFMLPNQDEFEIQENDGVTEIKFLHHDNEISKHRAATDDSFELFKDDSAEEMANSEDDLMNAMMKNKKNGVPADFSRIDEPKDSGVTEDSLFDLFTSNHPLRGKFWASSGQRMEDIPAHRKKEDDFINFLQNAKPKDIEVTEDSILSFLLEGNPSKKLSRKDQEVQNLGKSKGDDDELFSHDSKHSFSKDETKKDSQEKTTRDKEKNVGNIAYDGTKKAKVTENSDREKSSDIFGKERKNLTSYNQSRFANIQKIPMKEEKMMFESLINNLTGFFSKINKQIQSYVKEKINW